MKDDRIYVEAEVNKVQTRADFSLAVTINIPEYLADDAGAKLLKMRKKPVKVLISGENVTFSEETVEVFEQAELIVDRKHKSPSKKMRHKLYHKFIAEGGDQGDRKGFEEFYKKEIDYLCGLIDTDIDNAKRSF